MNLIFKTVGNRKGSAALVNGCEIVELVPKIKQGNLFDLETILDWGMLLMFITYFAVGTALGESFLCEFEIWSNHYEFSANWHFHFDQNQQKIPIISRVH